MGEASKLCKVGEASKLCKVGEASKLCKAFLFTFVLLAMASCADYDATEAVAPGGDPLDVRAEVEQQYVTRASDGGFADGDQIGVFIVNWTSPNPSEGGASPILKPTGNHADNVRFTYSEADGKWTGSYQLYWKDKVTPVDAYGYYPFDAELQNTQAYPFTIQKNQRDQLKTGRQLTGYEQSDFLWAKQEKVVPTAATVSLKHHHLMAGIKVVLAEGEGFQEGEWAGIDKTVLIESTILDATINLQTGTVAPQGSTPDLITPLPLREGQGGRSAFRAVVVPQTVAAGKTLITLTIDNTTYRFTRPEAMTYIPGKLHQFTFDVQKTVETGDYQFTLISEAVTAWENDPQSHNGEAREYLVIELTENDRIHEKIEALGLDPNEIEALKLVGTLSCWPWDDDFEYMRNMKKLQAINMKELHLKNYNVNIDNIGDYDSRSWVERTYGTTEGYDGDPGEYVLPGGAFENMSQLRYFVFPDTLKAIGNMAFAGTSLCGSLILPEGLKYIGDGSFVAYGHQHALLTGELYIPSSVEYMGGAFSSPDDSHDVYFSNEIILPERLKVLGGGAFTGCRFMTGTVRIPEGLTVVNEFLPAQISGPAIIPQGVKVVNGVGKGITSLYLPEGVEEIGFGAFWDCSKLEGTLRFPSTIRNIGVNAFAGVALSHIELPEGLEIIEEGAFCYMGNLLDTLRIPSTVRQIRNGAFRFDTQLTAVILPAGLEGIQDDAFQGCYSLDYIECQAVNPPEITGNTFSGVEKNNFTLIVPKGSVEKYKNAPHWCEFKRISSDQKFVCRPMKAKLLNKSNVRQLVLNADTNWEVQSCPSWIHLDKTSGSKKTELQVTIDAMPHGQGDREGKVAFRLARNDDDGQPVTCDYLVQQFDYEYEEDGIIPCRRPQRASAAA